MTEYDQGMLVLNETVLNCNQIYDKVSLPDWYNGLQFTYLCLTEPQIKAMSYQWWTGKYLITINLPLPDRTPDQGCVVSVVDWEIFNYNAIFYTFGLPQ